MVSSINMSDKSEHKKCLSRITNKTGKKSVYRENNQNNNNKIDKKKNNTIRKKHFFQLYVYNNMQNRRNTYINTSLCVSDSLKKTLDRKPIKPPITIKILQKLKPKRLNIEKKNAKRKYDSIENMVINLQK